MEIQAKWTSPNDFEWRANGVILHASPAVPKAHKISPTPYELFLFSLASSTGMEMIKHFKEHNTTFSDLTISVNGHLIPKFETKIFNSIDLLIFCQTDSPIFEILNAVEYSQFLTSGISAMISKTIPINWKLYVNDEIAGEGIPNFQEPNENVY